MDAPGLLGTSAEVALSFLHSLSSLTASGDCYTFGSNQHGQLGTSARRVSRAPCQVQGLQGIKIVMVACGDAFTVAIGTGDEWELWGQKGLWAGPWAMGSYAQGY